MQRTNAHTWALVARRGSVDTLVDESAPQAGVKRARIDFERKHRLVVEGVATEPPSARAPRGNDPSDLALTALD